MRKINSHATAHGRRRFLKQAASGGLALGTGPLMLACGSSGTSAEPPPPGTAPHSYFFNLPRAEANTDYYLAAGARQHLLAKATPQQIARIKAANPHLAQVNEASITHVGEDLPLPASSIMMCCVKGVAKTSTKGEWSMHNMFLHIPSTAKTPTTAQHLTAGAAIKATTAPATPAPLQFADAAKQAVAIVFSHPEIMCFDTDGASYINSIIMNDPNVYALATIIAGQPAATATPGGWATLVPRVDPKTGVAQLDSNGQAQYFTQYSKATLQASGIAIRSVLTTLKNDTTVGQNITNNDKTVANANLAGKIWVVKNCKPPGAPTSATQKLARTPLAAAIGPTPDATFATTDWATGPGFSFSVQPGPSYSRRFTFTSDNWYVRYLGLYLRFFDAAGNPIPYANLDSATQAAYPTTLLNGTYDCYVGMSSQEQVIFGIPFASATQTYTVTVPSQAASVAVIAGGLGNGSKLYPQTVAPGAILTVALDMALPLLFLGLSAASGYKSFASSLSDGNFIDKIVIGILTLVGDITVYSGFDSDPDVFMNLIGPLTNVLLTVLGKEIATALAGAFAIDAIPFVGMAVQAVMSLGLAATFAETCAEVTRSPWNYVSMVNLTHNVTVTINHAADNPSGFPAVATKYKLIAICDHGAPVESPMIAMPATTQTAPLSYTFNGLPSGGRASIIVTFYADSGWVAASGTSGSFDNTLDSTSITIIENVVQLTAFTTYSHKQKIAIANGKHVWQATATPPAAAAPNTNMTVGAISEFVGITVSEPFTSVGYAWRSYSPDLPSYSVQGGGQTYQMANLSFGATPQGSYMAPGGGFGTAPRMAYYRSGTDTHGYYIDGSSGRFMVRRINFTQPGAAVSFDAPGSNLAVGVFNLPSDAMQFHPTGKLISLNAANSKLEILELDATPGPDAGARQAIAVSGPGQREGLLSGPVCMGITPTGVILVIDNDGTRGWLKAFDTGGNPALYFSNGGSLSSAKALQAINGTSARNYLDICIDFGGYIYVLAKSTGGNQIYTLDLYDSQGNYLHSTANVNAAKLTVDLFRNVYTLNMEAIFPASGITEPSVSQWIPSTPAG